MCFAAWEPLFSLTPEDNRPLPEGTDLLYLPGGYPEKHYEKLRQAWQRMQSIRNYAESGGRVLAECGGMIYLSKGILLRRSEHSDSGGRLQAGYFRSLSRIVRLTGA